MADKSRYFVFLEFTNPKVRNFLLDLGFELSGKESKSGAHITVRGPYASPPSSQRMNELEEHVRGSGVIIGGAGTFKTEDGFSVHLRAQSPAFDEIWWKPDYPAYLYRRQPHITVFETQSARDARSVEVFLRSEKIEIFTLSVRLSVYKSKQLSLFDLDRVETERDELENWERWNVRSGILNRARKIGESLSGTSDPGPKEVGD